MGEEAGKVTIRAGPVGLSNDLLSASAGTSAGPISLKEFIRLLDRDASDFVAVERGTITNPDRAA